MAGQVVGRDDRRVAGDVDRVAAQSAVHLDVDARRGGEHRDRVVALCAVDAEPLDRDERDVPAGAVHAGLGEDEEVVGLGADDEQRVEPVAAVDVHRRVGDVRDAVGARAGDHLRLGVLLEERADDERVVVVLAVER